MKLKMAVTVGFAKGRRYNCNRRQRHEVTFLKRAARRFQRRALKNGSREFYPADRRDVI